MDICVAYVHPLLLILEGSNLYVNLHVSGSHLSPMLLVFVLCFTGLIPKYLISRGRK
jgi:hypothetical protein